MKSIRIISIISLVLTALMFVYLIYSQTKLSKTINDLQPEEDCGCNKTKTKMSISDDIVSPEEIEEIEEAIEVEK